jgi:intracellular septation protein
MAILIDYLPLILFFGAFKFYGIMWATGVAMAASALQIIYLYSRKKVNVIHWLQLGVISVFGGLTLALDDPNFIQWKPSVIYLLFAVILLGGKIFWHRDLLRFVMKNVELPEHVWGKLTWSWSLFFIALAVLNRFVANNFSMDAWVNFKFWGTLGLLFVFAIVQALFLMRYLKEPEATAVKDKVPTDTEAQ